MAVTKIEWTEAKAVTAARLDQQETNTFEHNHSTDGSADVIAGGLAAEAVDAGALGDAASYTNARTRIYSLGSADFHPINSYTKWSNDGTLWNNGNTGTQTYIAGIHLPNNAIVTEVSYYWFYTTVNASGQGGVGRRTIGTGGYAAVSSNNADTLASPNTVTDSSPTNATINNSSYSYYCWATINPDDIGLGINLIGVKITYTILTPLP